MDRRQTRKSVNSVLWAVFLPFWHSPFCWLPKLLLQTNCILEGPLHFLGLRMTVSHIPGATTAENLLEEKTRSSLETTPSISNFQGWCFTGKFFTKVLTLSLWNTIFSLVYFNKQLKILWPERRPDHLITSLTSSYQCTIMVTEKLWMAPNQDLFLGFQTVHALAKRAWSKVYSSPR